MNLMRAQPSQEWLDRFNSRVALLLATRLGERAATTNCSLAWELAQDAIPNAADLPPEDAAELFLWR